MEILSGGSAGNGIGRKNHDTRVVITQAKLLL